MALLTITEPVAGYLHVTIDNPPRLNAMSRAEVRSTAAQSC